MTLVTEDRRRVVALAKGARVGIGRTRVGVVATRLAFPVGLGIAPTPSRPLIVAAVLRPKALLARPRLNQRAVDREMFLRQQPAAIGQMQHLSKEPFDHLMRQQPIAILENVE